MSSTKNLDSIVVLDGTNFKQWKAAIMAYAMLNGFWDAFDVTNKPSPADPAKITAEDRRDERNWRQMDQKGMGLIRSKVNPSIRAVFDTSFTIPATTATGTASSTSTSSASVAFSAAHRQKNTAAATPTAANMLAYLEATYGTPGIITMRNWSRSLYLRVSTRLPVSIRSRRTTKALRPTVLKSPTLCTQC
jgi:hypothetical protein